MSEITSELKKISDILITPPTIYHIPEFQRRFVWGREEVLQLLEDVREDAKDFTITSARLEGYLLGNIVLIQDEQDENRMIVVDGQQRLTTLSLIGKAIYKILLEKSRNDPETWITYSDVKSTTIVTDDDDSNATLRITHDPSLYFGNYYKKLVFDDSDITDDDIVTADDQNISDVFNTAYEFISDLSDSQFKIFINIFKNKIKLIVTIAPNEEKAFQLFEVLNDRGRSLEPMDLIKNSFLKTLSASVPQKKIDDFIDNWKGAIEALSKKSLQSSLFMKHFILFYFAKNIQTDKVFSYFKRENQLNSTEIIDFSSKMADMAKLYSEIETGDYSAFNNNPKLHLIIKILGIKQYHAIYMLFKSETQEDQERLLDTLVRHGATFVFSDQRTNNIESFLPDVIREYKTNLTTVGYSSAFTGLLESFEKNIVRSSDTLVSIVSNKKYVGNNGKVSMKALTILRFIEQYLCEGPYALNVPQRKKLTVEHILSQNIDMTDITFADLGFSDEQERKNYLHRIGNLTLLFSNENSSLGSKQFKDKKATYDNCDFIITKTIIKEATTTIGSGPERDRVDRINRNLFPHADGNDQWTKTLIETRSSEIGNLLLKLVQNKL